MQRESLEQKLQSGKMAPERAQELGHFGLPGPTLEPVTALTFQGQSCLSISLSLLPLPLPLARLSSVVSATDHKPGSGVGLRHPPIAKCLARQFLSKNHSTRFCPGKTPAEITPPAFFSPKIFKPKIRLGGQGPDQDFGESVTLGNLCRRMAFFQINFGEKCRLLHFSQNICYRFSRRPDGVGAHGLEFERNCIQRPAQAMQHQILPFLRRQSHANPSCWEILTR